MLLVLQDWSSIWGDNASVVTIEFVPRPFTPVVGTLSPPLYS